jgi:hypothetical protein
MESFSLAFLFLTQLALAVAGLMLWWRAKDRMAAIEAKAEEGLDDQDLMEFQERMASLLAQVREAGRELNAQIDARRASLESQSVRARDAEKRLAEKIKGFEKLEEQARKRLDELMAGKAKPAPAKKKKASRAKAPKPAAAAPAEAPAEEAVLPVEAPVVSYLKREFRQPEPQAPVSPTAARYLKVYALADEGKSREEIAKACGYLPGEVELILNLRPRKG